MVGCTNGKAVAAILDCVSFHVTTHVQTMIVKRNDEMSDSVESKVFFQFYGCVEPKLKLFIVAHGKEECGFVRRKMRWVMVRKGT